MLFGYFGVAQPFDGLHFGGGAQSFG